MRAWLYVLALAAPALVPVVRADVPEPTSTELNVNSRYTVESVDFSPQRDYRLSGQVVAEMQKLVGEHVNVEALSRLSQRMTEELRAQSVTFRLDRGFELGHVRVIFEVERRQTSFDVSLSRLLYDSREGWNGNGQAVATFGPNSLTLAGVSNNDDLVERYSGIRARYDRLNLAGGRLRLGFEFDTFREQYDGSTVTALQSSDSSPGAQAYRSRMNFEPSATFVIAKPLTLTVGMSFESMQPDLTGAHTVAANALVDTLRYHQRWQGDGDGSQELEAFYQLRSATRALGSDSLYTKHTARARYAYRQRKHLVEVAVMAGVIYGQAPLFERFVLGTSNTLRGWSRFDLDPLGGNRVAHASVTYGYQILRLFYDTGAVWDRGGSRDEKHSVGAGVTTGLGMFGKDALLLALAFPLRQGHVQPVFVAGMNF